MGPGAARPARWSSRLSPGRSSRSSDESAVEVYSEPSSLVAVSEQCAAIERWAETCESVPELRDASNKLAAIDEYLSRTSNEGRAAVAAAMRRLEVRIGVLLGRVTPGARSDLTVPREEQSDLPRNRQSDFRTMAEHEEVVEEVIAESTDEAPASRRKVMDRIRQAKANNRSPARRSICRRNSPPGHTVVTGAVIRPQASVLPHSAQYACWPL